MARRQGVAKDVRQELSPCAGKRVLNIARATGFYGVSPERRAHPGVDRRMRAGEHNFSGGRRESQPRVEPMPVCFPDSGLLLLSEAKASGRQGSFPFPPPPLTPPTPPPPLLP